MLDLNFYNPTRILFGRGFIADIYRYIPFIAQLEANGMVKSGERQSIAPDVGRKIIELSI